MKKARHTEYECDSIYTKFTTRQHKSMLAEVRAVLPPGVPCGRDWLGTGWQHGGL